MLGATHFPLANRLQPLLELDTECRGYDCARSAWSNQGDKSAQGFSIHGDASGGLYLNRSALEGLFPKDGRAAWMDPPRLSSRYCGAFAAAHFMGEGGGLCERGADGVDDCTHGRFGQAGRLRVFG